MWGNALAMPDLSSLALDTVALEPKSFRGYVLLCCYLRRFGSAPSDDSGLAAILGVTPRYLQRRAWPQLGHLFALDDDGRIVHPEIERLAPPAARHPDPVRSAINRANAMRGREKRSQPTLVGLDGGANRQQTASEPAANSEQIGEQTGAKLPANSMAGASENFPVAAPDASGAPAASRAGSLSPSDLESSGEAESGSKDLESARASERARAGAPAANGEQTASEPAASGEQIAGQAGSELPSEPAANGEQTASEPAAKPGAALPRQRRPDRRALTPIPPDWQPSPEGEAEARRRGYDPATLAGAFRNHYTARGEVRANWDAQFLEWCRRETERDAELKQAPIIMPIAGGRGTEAVPSLSEADRALEARLRPVNDAWNADRTLPGPVSLQRAREAIAEGDGPLLDRWLEAWTAWTRAGRPARMTPPPLAKMRLRRKEFVGDLDALEDAVNARAAPKAGTG